MEVNAGGWDANPALARHPVILLGAAFAVVHFIH
jgi:hypothetical protein